MRTISLTRGLKTIVDDQDFIELNQYKWYAQSTHSKRTKDRFYAARRTPTGIVLMHSVLHKPNKGQITDHISGNSLDNQRKNLRSATRTQNNCNQAAQTRPNKRSKFKGVGFDSRDRPNPWMAYINYLYKRTYLGVFPTEIEAAAAYNKAASLLFGDRAYLNIL